MSLGQTINYDNSANFEVNTDISFTALAALAFRGVENNEMFGASIIGATATATRGLGVLSGTANNGATITNVAGVDLLDVTGAVSDRYWSYDSDNADFGEIGTIRFKVRPAYTGGPAANRTVFELVGAGTDNQIVMVHQATTNLQVRMSDSTGVLVIAKNFGNWSPTSGQEYEFELNVDVTNGNTELFIDGVQLGTAATNVYTRTAITDFTLGSAGAIADYFYRDIEAFSTVQHIADFAGEIPRLYKSYPITEQSIVPNTFVTMSELLAFAAVTSSPAGSSLGFVTYVNGLLFYHDGANWVTSIGTLAQSNTAAEIELNKGALPTTAPVKFIAILLSTTGAITPTITSHSITYDFFGIQIPCEVCVIWGYLLDNCVAVDGGLITFETKNKKIYDDDGNFISIDESTTTDANGYFRIELAKTVDANQIVFVKQSFTDSKGKPRTRNLEIIVPDLDTQRMDLAIVT